MIAFVLALLRGCTSVPVVYGVGIVVFAFLFLAIGLKLTEPAPVQETVVNDTTPEAPPHVIEPPILTIEQPIITPIEQPIITVGPKAQETPMVLKPIVAPPVVKIRPIERKQKLPMPCDTFIALDTETANSERGSVCVVAMTKVVNGKIVDRYYSLVRPVPLVFSVINQRIHGISAVTVRRAPTIDRIWDEMQAFMGDLPIIVHNIGFDKFALEQSLERVGVLVAIPMHCTMAFAKKKGFASGLKPLSDHFGIPLVHHSAPSDADACALCFLAMQELPFEIPVVEKVEPKISPLTGKTVVFTGEADLYSRSELQKMAEQHGALVRKGISGKTNYLITGENPGESKVHKATYEFTNCELIDVESFLDMVA